MTNAHFTSNQWTKHFYRMMSDLNLLSVEFNERNTDFESTQKKNIE